MSQWKSFLVVALFLVGLMPTGVADEESRTYPNGWTHRPIMEYFTGLSCPPCMDIQPDISTLWKEFREDPSAPVTFVSFHQINGGSGDEFASQQAKDRYNHYSVQGTPDAQFDGGYIEELGGGDGTYDTYKDHYYESGERDVKPTELDVYQEFREDRFIFTVNLTYLGEGGFSNPLDPDTLDSSVYLFVVEDDIMAWSSAEEKEVMMHNVFRENALNNEQVSLQPEETWTHEVEWIIPDTIMYPSGHEDKDGNPQEGEHPILTPINPAKISVVAVVYDNDDTSRTTTSGKTGNAADTPRAIQSATPESTAYDNNLEFSSVLEVDINQNLNYEGRLDLTITFGDNTEITSAYVVYFIKGDEGSTNESGSEDSWSFTPMSIDGNLGTAMINIEGGLLSYHIVSFNSDNVFNASSLYSYVIQYFDYSVSSPISHDICNATEINFTAVNNGNSMDTIQVRISNLQELEDAGFMLALPALQYQIESDSEQLIRVIIDSTGVSNTELDYPLTLNVSTTLQGWDVSAEATTIMKFVDCQGGNEQYDNSTLPEDNNTDTEDNGLYEGDEAGECSDEADNDRNGLFDCDDEGCSGSPACKAIDPIEESGLSSLSLLYVLTMLGIISILRRR